jgi:nitrite reductase/ring-hydroxylating ferredoxin subunit
MISVGRAADLPEGSCTVIVIDGTEVLVTQHQGTYYAVENECTHKGCWLSDGDIENGQAVCLCHGAIFDLQTGAALAGPAPAPLRTYFVRVVEGMVEVART